ncbi:MAG TPA: hypothetical protein VGW38_21415, partial [Chloroflexota bacterium]|nr:hypothetical protein [Chloroflexota bacterium]
MGLLLTLAACTPSPEPPDALRRDAYIRLCVAWDMADARLQATGDTLPLDRATVQEAEMICGGIAEPAPDLEQLRKRLGESREWVPGFSSISRTLDDQPHVDSMSSPIAGSEAPRTVIVAYQPITDRTPEFLACLRDHLPVLRAEGPATDRPPVVLRAASGAFVEVFEWRSDA